MNLRRSAVILILVCATSNLGAADVYLQKDEQGVPTFSDEPKKDAKKIELEPLPTYSAPVVPEWKYEPPVKKAKASGSYQYDSLTIVSPQDQELIRSNDPLVQVQVQADPPLQVSLGHQLKVYLNDELQVTTTQPEFYLPNTNPGGYQLRVQLVDREGTILKTSLATFNKVTDTRVRDLQQQQGEPDPEGQPSTTFAPTTPRAQQMPKYIPPSNAQPQPLPSRTAQ